MSDTADAADDNVPFDYAALTTRRHDRPLDELPRLVARAAALVWRAAPRDLTITLTLSALAGLLSAAQLLVLRRVLSGLVADSARTSTLLLPIAALVILLLLSGLASTWASERQRVLNELVARHAQGIVATAACAADLVDFERPAFHNRLQRALSSLGGRPIAVTSALGSLLGAGTSLVAVGAAIATVQPLLLLVVVGAGLPLWLVSRALGRQTFGFDVAQTEADRRRGYLLGLLVFKPAAAELRAYGLAGHLRSDLDGLWDDRIGRLREISRRRSLTGTLARMVSATMVGALMVALVWLVTSGRLTLAEAGVAAGAAVVLGQGLQAVSAAVGALYESSLFLEDAEAFVRAAARVAHDTTTACTADAFETLELRDVHFRYPGSDRDAIAGLSLTVRAGELVALVGANGSGKSTVAKILAQLYSPTDGAVVWNGAPVSPNDQAHLREQIAVLLQNYERYLFTAGENIGFGRVEAITDRDRLLDSAVRAGIDQRVAQLPDGFATLLGPEFYGGTDLSGGEWQRVALARAFFRRAPLLILDEPTSALDPDAEHDLFARLRKLWSGRAVVLVSHRFSNVTGADRIVVLDHGRIAEQGTHTELMALDGRYASMFRRQAAPYQLATAPMGGGA